MGYLLGVDSSTTATKALLVDEAGRVVGRGVSEYEYATPRPLWAEQHPDLWWNGTVNAIRQALSTEGVAATDVAGVGLTGQMHGLVLLDDHHEPVRPAILWNDQRSSAECEILRERIGQERLIAITGNDALTGFTASKLLWVARNEPGALAAARRVLLPKDYVRFRLTGDFATDRAGASGTQLFDLASRDWSPEVVAATGITMQMLPATHEGDEVTGRVSADTAVATGLPAGIPVVAGAGDQAANAVGTGVFDGGEATLSLGTSGVVFAATESPAFDAAGRVHAFCHAVAGRWHMMGVMLSAAGSLRWLRDVIAPDVGFAELTAEAATVAPGSEGLLFLPYLSGERTPHPDPLARGAFIGLTVRHERRHLVRAVLEGVAFGLRDGLVLMTQAGVHLGDQIRASGGGTKSELWRQVISDVLGLELATMSTAEGAAYGAAILAAPAAGWFSSPVAAARQWIDVAAVTAPGDDNYDASYELYRRQYPSLAATFTALGELAQSESP